MAAIAWTADKLVTGEFASPHMMQVRNLLESAPGLTYRYPMDHGGAQAGAGDVALRGTLDMRPGSRAFRFAMTTIDNDLAEDTSLKNGAGANDDEQLQVQPYAMPDVAPEQFMPFAGVSLAQLEH